MEEEEEYRMCEYRQLWISDEEGAEEMRNGVQVGCRRLTRYCPYRGINEVVCRISSYHNYTGKTLDEMYLEQVEFIEKQQAEAEDYWRKHGKQIL